MKDLMTRKIVLGLLMTLVLAFGVPGIVDAITVTPGDSSTTLTPVRTNTRGSAFTVEPRVDTVRESVTVSTNGSIQLIVSGGGKSLRTTRLSLTEKNADGTSQPATDTSGSNGVFFSGSTNLGASVSITPEFTGLGKRIITVTDGTPARTSDPAYTKTAKVTYTYYVVKPDSQIRPTDTIRLTKGGSSLRSPGYITGVDGTSDFYIQSGSGDFPVSYSATGGGLLYHEATGERTALTADTVISSRIRVYLDANATGSTDAEDFTEGTTNVVTVNIGNTATSPVSSVKAVYIYGTPTLDINLTPDGGSEVTGETGSLTGEGTSVTANANDATSKYSFTGGTQGKKAGIITATVMDGQGTPVVIPDVVVKFDVVDKTHRGGYLDSSADLTGTIVNDKNRVPTPTLPPLARTSYVRTTADGKAALTYQMGTAAGRQRITVTAVGLSSKEVTAELSSSSVSSKKLTMQSPQRRTDNSKKFDLIAVVTEDDNAVSGQVVTFRTDRGTLTRVSSAPETGEVTTNEEVNVVTNALGEAYVVYDIGDNTGRQEIDASIVDSGDRQSVTFVVNGSARRDPPPPTTQPARLDITVYGDDEDTSRPVIVNALNSAGQAVPISIPVTLSGTVLTTPQTVNTRAVTTITPPTAAGTYTLTATDPAGNYASDTETITVGEPEGEGTLNVEAVGVPVNNQQTIEVTVEDADGDAPTGEVEVTLTGPGISRTVDTRNGTGRAIITLPNTATYTLRLSADGYETRSVTLRVPSTSGAPQDDTEPETRDTTTGGTARSVQIASDPFPSGTANRQLAQPLSAQVLDANNRGVANVRVTFQVISGKGRLSQRGTGRGIRAQTDRNGTARANYTPLSDGTSTVRATAAGVTQTVTFTITAGADAPSTGETTTPDTTSPRTYKAGTKIPSSEVSLTFTGSRTLNGSTYTCVGSGECVISNGFVTKGEVRVAAVPAVQAKTYKAGTKIPSSEVSLTFTGSRTLNGSTYTCVGSGECVISNGFVTKGEVRVAAATPATTPESNRTIAPDVQVGAANRPPMLWVDGGSIYALVGADVQKFAPGVDNALNITVGGGKVYWTEKTGERGGTINSANLDGSGVTELSSIFATPMGIAVDTEARRIYVANTGGRILSMNLDGSGIKTVFQFGSSHPIDIALSGGNVFCTLNRGGAPIERIDPKDQGDQPSFWDFQSISGTPGSLAIAGGKVYWTAKTGESAGTINSVNLNGTNMMELAEIRAVPMGIAVDTARSKLYWTNSRGRVQSANLDGSRIQNVVDGLGMPGDMVISNSIKAPKRDTPATITTKPTTTAGKNKYDVNGDGIVDRKDRDTLYYAWLADTKDLKYDVDGSGEVDIFDVRAIAANLDDGAAGAPTLLGMKLSAAQIDRIQEQIDLLIATGDRSPVTLKMLIYLQQLIAMARPEKTQLLANYPNPFNPETWIPYELATGTDVRITIYNTHGVVVRTLQLGHQSAGYYTGRERAAYWDGRNAFGEQVASGIYFYQLETDEMSLMRKMVILK